MNEGQLVKLAEDAAKMAYVPYSGFKVGAALLCKSGKIYSGCNIENAAFSPSNCAERTAVFKAVSEGEREFAAIAVTGAFADNSGDKHRHTVPCGVCLQVLAEFCEPEKFVVIAANPAGEYKKYLLCELLPHGFAL